MNREEHLLTIAMEECCEVGQRLSKVKRFGREEIQPGQNLTNTWRLMEEFAHLIAAMDMAGFPIDLVALLPAMEQKRKQVEHFLKYSEQCGTLAAPKKEHAK
jgi:hypothetical protein